jgi:hypothetical protein
MSTQSDTTTIETYLPAGFQPSDSPGPVERFLTKPFRRQAEIWLRGR